MKLVTVRFFVSVFMVMCSFSVIAMEQNVVKTPFELLPADINRKIFEYLVSAPTLDEAVNNIKALRQTSTTFANLLNSASFNKRLIDLLVQNFQANNIQVALTLNTPGAREWLQAYIQTEQGAQEANHIWSNLYNEMDVPKEKAVIFAKGLLKAGFDPNTPTTHGMNLVKLALFNEELVKALLEGGVDINEPDMIGQSVIDFSKAAIIPDSTRSLLEKYANKNEEL